MPSKSRETNLPNLNKEDILSFAYGTALQLDWKPTYAGPEALLVYTKKKWNSSGEEILIQATDEKMILTSTMVHNESFDVFGKNKKNIDQFEKIFNLIKTKEPDADWSGALDDLRKKTAEEAVVQAKEQEEINQTMRSGSSNLFVTYFIIGVNVLVFILMAVDGAGILAPESSVHIKWGSNYSPLTLTGDWWRLATCMFIHFGIIHLAMNCYALYMAGAFLEPMLGKLRYIIAYLCTGLLASVASVWWHSDGVNSAGASGAIFGLYGVFLALLFTNLIPKKVRSALLQSIGVFVLFNLFYGMKSGIDNSAHIGGLVSGMIIGFIFYFGLKNRERQRPAFIVPIVLLISTAIICWLYIKTASENLPANTRQNALNQRKAMSHADSEKYYSTMQSVSELEESALKPYNENSISEDERTRRLVDSSKKDWTQMLVLLNKAKDYDISEKERERVALLIEYVRLRIEEIDVLEQLRKEENNENTEKLSATREKMSNIESRLNALDQ